MSIQTELDRINAAKNDIVSAITEKGVSVPNGTKIDGIAALIAAIAGGDSISMPDGYTMETGIYVPTSDISSTIQIQLEHTFRWSDTGKESACQLMMVGIDICKGTQAAAFGAHVKFGVGERNHQMVTTTSGCSTSTTVFCNPSSTTTFNVLKLTGTSSYPLKAGHSYLWIVIGETV